MAAAAAQLLPFAGRGMPPPAAGIGRSPASSSRSDREVSLAKSIPTWIVAAIRPDDEAQHRWGCGWRAVKAASVAATRTIAADNATRVALLGDAGSGKTHLRQLPEYVLVQGIITAGLRHCRRRLRQVCWSGCAA